MDDFHDVSKGKPRKVGNAHTDAACSTRITPGIMSSQDNDNACDMKEHKFPGITPVERKLGRTWRILHFEESPEATLQVRCKIAVISAEHVWVGEITDKHLTVGIVGLGAPPIHLARETTCVQRGLVDRRPGR